ncbi:hypothetical protein GJ744_008585 [Endocarpon pusillum]|uniref:Uncharacterized protein n=1 Tax=Endocarpon pusillum TaxID=364733 RepID=A0A8H7AKQ4_9EURO|nr:hypothetical protein GJ744_008585 [Endocarpon pusillum]
MKRLLIDFVKKLGELTKKGATTKLGRALMQMKADNSLPRIKEIQDEMSIRYQSLSICIPFALDRASAPPSSPAGYDTSYKISESYVLPSPPIPPLTPTYEKPALPSRQSSDASPPCISLASEIQAATRNLDIDRVGRLLDDDSRGELIKTVDSAGRTLVDIAICDGKRTKTSQVFLVEMLLRRVVKFTLVKNKRHNQTYTDLLRTIQHLNQRRRSSASAKSASSFSVIFYCRLISFFWYPSRRNGDPNMTSFAFFGVEWGYSKSGRGCRNIRPKCLCGLYPTSLIWQTLTSTESSPAIDGAMKNALLLVSYRRWTQTFSGLILCTWS